MKKEIPQNKLRKRICHSDSDNSLSSLDDLTSDARIMSNKISRVESENILADFVQI